MMIAITKRSIQRKSPSSICVSSMILRGLRKVVSLVILCTVIRPNQSQTEAMKASPHTFVVKQDNEDIVLKIKGDEHEHWMTNQNDYTVVRDRKGKYKFAALSSDEESLVPTGQDAGNSEPKHTKKKDLRPPRKKGKSEGSSSDDESINNVITVPVKLGVESTTIFTRHKRCRRRLSGGGKSSCGTAMDGIPSTPSPYEPDANVPSPAFPGDQHHRRITTSNSKSIGTLKNLVILLRFQDHRDRRLPSKEDISVLMNSDEVDADLAPTGSVKMLYLKNSYGQLTIESEVTDWILLDNTEEYYANGQAGLATTFHEALRNALDELEKRGFPFADFDADGDNQIDSITFLTSGYGAEWGSEDVDGVAYEDRIWSHKWSISEGGWKGANSGVRITDYFVSPSLWGTSGNKIGRVGVIAHEIGHYLNLPDLYDIDNSSNGLGFFCMMANSWGSDGSQLNPPEFSAWTKIQLGWSMPETPSIGMENRVSRSEGLPTNEAPYQVFKIGDGQFGFPIGEYLLIEFRQTNWLKGGIAIYHVDEQQSSHNNEGFPNQIEGDIKWPYNGNHYIVALAPADGNFDLERRINHGTSDDLYSIGQSLLPSEDANGPFPNTDSYQNGIIQRTGVKICITSDIDEPYMRFLFADDNPIQPWMTLLSEDFENGYDTAISFESSKAKVVNKNQCKGFKCVTINTSAASMSVTVETVCLTELQISFKFRSLGLKNKEQLLLEYSPAYGDGDGDVWNLLKAWTKGNEFRNRKWYTELANLSLADMEAATVKSSNIVLRFRSTSLKKKVLIDNLKIEGKF